MKKTLLTIIAMVTLLTIGSGCGTMSEDVPQGTIGRIKTRSGWAENILPQGRQTCWGFDKMYLVQSTQETYTEPMNILVGGKINLSLEIQVRCSLTPDKKIQKSIFEEVIANSEGYISNAAIYKTYLKMKIVAIPMEIIGSKPDVATVVANLTEITSQVRKRVIEESKTTPLSVYAVEITNWDWPKSITDAQEELGKIQLKKEQERANIEAALIRSEGDLQIAEKDKLVELKKAEAVAESIKIIKDELAGAPEYLNWHQIRMLSEAAQGPNNAFIIVPYGSNTDTMVNNAQLKQMLETKSVSVDPNSVSVDPNSKN